MLPPADMNNSEPWYLTLKRSSSPITLYFAHTYKVIEWSIYENEKLLLFDNHSENNERSAEQFSAAPLQCIENESDLSIENDTNKACDDDSIKIVSSFSENYLSIKDTINVINDVVQLIDEASCSSKMNSNVEIVSSFSENHLNMKDTIDVIDDVVQLVNEASCSSKISNVEEYSTGLEMQGMSSPAIDPAKWLISPSLVEHFILNQPRQDISNIDFIKTRRIYGKYLRQLPRDIFSRKLHNGQTQIRDWLLYSSSKNALFCFHCLLFSKGKSLLGNIQYGLKNWAKCYDKVQKHEISPLHCESVRIWYLRTQRTKNNSIDKVLKKEMWSSRHEACKGVLSGYKEILEVLKTLSEDTTQSPPTRHEANSIKKKLEKLEFVFMLKVWTPILQRFDATSKTLQSKDINLSIVVSLYESLEFYVQGCRKLFDNILNKSKELCGKSTFSWEKSRVIKKKRYFDDSNSTDTIHHGDDKMKNETFYVIIDTLSSHLCERKKAYINIHSNFGFLNNLINLDSLTLREKALHIVNIYNQDIDTLFIEKIIQFKKIAKSFSEEDLTINGLFTKLSNSPLALTFPNVLIILRIYACMPCSNASSERSFSVLRRIKNYLRSTLSQNKTSSLTLLCIENDILRNMDWSDTIHTFLSVKVRKKDFK
ncbi:hypothetical protein ACI65C_006717 [Semiaphis heraclei]